MNKKIKILVVVTTYNSEKTIKECIKSIINNTYTNFELVIVDDFSSDNTKKILKKINAKKSSDGKVVSHYRYVYRGRSPCRLRAQGARLHDDRDWRRKYCKSRDRGWCDMYMLVQDGLSMEDGGRAG